MKASGVLALVLCMALLSGCVGVNPIQLGDRLIIDAIGIDTENDCFTLTLICDDMFAQNNENQNSGKIKILTFTGKTPADAFGKVPFETGLSPLFSQAKLLIIGHKTAENDLPTLLDFFMREYKARSNISIAVAGTTAKELLNALCKMGDNAVNTLTQSLELGYQDGSVVDMPLFVFINYLHSKTDCTYCPYLGITDENRVAPIGTAVFREYTLCTVLGLKQTVFLLLLTDRLKGAYLTLNDNGILFTLSVIKAETSIHTEQNADGTVFFVSSSLVCDVTDFQSLSKELDTQAIEKITNRYILLQNRALTDTCYTLLNCDICRLYRRALLFTNRSNEKTINDMQSCTDIRLSVDTKIRRTGKIIHN